MKPAVDRDEEVEDAESGLEAAAGANKFDVVVGAAEVAPARLKLLVAPNVVSDDGGFSDEAVGC